MLKDFFKKKRRSYMEINPEDIFLDSSNLSSLEFEKLEGLLAKPINSFILNLIFIFILIISLIFLWQMYDLQINKYPYYQKKSDNNRLNFSLIFANRGQILDRQNIPLAYNLAVSSSSPILKREYISDSGFSHLLGYINYPKGDKAGNYWQTEFVGKDGLELFYNDLLKGVNGKKLTEKDVSANILGDNTILQPIAGNNLILTIDKDLQKELFNNIKKVAQSREYISGTGILMNINNGEILAMVSYPEYDNNLLTNANSPADSQKISNLLIDKKTPFLNRAVSGLFTPGSVVKPFMAYAALTEGIVNSTTKILSTGALIIKNKYGGADSVFKDWKTHGSIDVIRAMAQSSDEYFYQVGGGYKEQKGLGIKKITEYAELFGLASTTGIDLPNEARGIIPSPDWKRINFLEGDWKLGNTYHTSIGQYGFQITPLELIRYISAIGNGGNLVTPHLFLSSTQEGNKNWPIINLNLNPKNLSYVQEGMRQVVLTGGTATALNIDGLKIAAKTGTAELGFKKLTVNSLITGYFPYDKPQYAFVIIMENGKVGNTSGATQAALPFLTYFRDFKNQYLK